MAEHYYTATQTSRFSAFRFAAWLRNNDFVFESAAGVFSKKRVDTGSTLLANKTVIEQGAKVLDIGCGYGAVGIAIKKSYPD